MYVPLTQMVHKFIHEIKVEKRKNASVETKLVETILEETALVETTFVETTFVEPF